MVVMKLAVMAFALILAYQAGELRKVIPARGFWFLVAAAIADGLVAVLA